MDKSLNNSQVLLVVTATVLLLLAAFAFYLLQDPFAPIFSAAPTNTTEPPTALPSNTPAPSATSTPTRQTSYTPFAELLTASPSAETPAVTETGTMQPTTTLQTPNPPTRTSTLAPGTTPTLTDTAAPGTYTVTPSASQTLSPGEYGFTGRIVQNGTPVANVVVEFSDDDPARQQKTNQGGHYWFITLAPGTSFNLSFYRTDNPQVTPVSEISDLTWFEGTLPSGTDVIAMPDLEIGLNVDGMTYELMNPIDGAIYSASYINNLNPLQFVWSTYNGAISYYVDFGKDGNDEPIWSSDVTASTNIMWTGNLDDGSHISEGNYWWRVVAKKTVGNYIQYVYTQKWEVIFNP